MQTKVLYLSDLKFNLETWKRELRFHFNEMDTFQEKLEEIAQREYGQKVQKTGIVYHPQRIKVSIVRRVKVNHLQRMKVNH